MIDPDTTFSFLNAIQQAFYAEQKDVTKLEVLAKLATDNEIYQESFLQTFASSAAKEETLAHFQQVQRWGITGFYQYRIAGCVW